MRKVNEEGRRQEGEEYVDGAKDAVLCAEGHWGVRRHSITFHCEVLTHTRTCVTYF